MPHARHALAACLLVAGAASNTARAACPDELPPEEKRACLQAELDALETAAASPTAPPTRPTLTALGGKSYQMDDAIVGWKDIQPALALDPRAREIAARATRQSRTARILGACSVASVGAGVVMFSQGGLGSGNAGSGIRAMGAAVGTLGGTGFLVGALISKGNARRSRTEAVGVYGVRASLQRESGGLQLVGGF